MAERATFRDRGIEIFKAAVEKDNNKQYDEALQLYQQGIEHFVVAIRYEKTESIKKTLEVKVEEYLSRAEELKRFLGKGSSSHTLNSGKQAKKRELSSPQDEQLRESLENTILTETPNVKWSDIAGLEAAKEAIKEAVTLPLKAPHLFESRLEPWKGILLYGPPGTGKTQLAKAVATECQCTFFSVSSADLVSKWVGESERLIKQLFKMARESKPAVIFLDEIDSLCSARKDNDNETSSRIKTEFLQQMQGVGNPLDGILVLAATNLPWNLDNAILRRFQRRVYIPLPDVDGRVQMLQIHLKTVPHSLQQQDFVALAKQTEGFSGSDIKTLAQDARYQAARILKLTTHFKQTTVNDATYWMPCSPGDPAAVEMSLKDFEQKGLFPMLQLPPVSTGDFSKALKSCSSSVKKEDIQKCKEFTKNYGMEGV